MTTSAGLGIFFWLVLSASLQAGQGDETYHWRPEEMSSRPPGRAGQRMQKIAGVRLLPEGREMPEDFNCRKEPCKFDLYYFTGKGFNLARPERKNILFIAGGPGQLVDNVNQGNRMLGHLEASHNIVYFDLRGGGRSVIPASNSYDRFLRAAYLADDIEEIRKALLKRKAWDAIYSHSWGSVPAQLYAAKFGTAKVKSLILSAPVVRDRDTHQARAHMTAANFELILTAYRSPTGEACSCKDRKLPVSVNAFTGIATQKVGDVISVVDPASSYNFCYIEIDNAKVLSRRLEALLGEIEAQFGSVDFVTDHYDALQKSTDAQARPRFPLEFYGALKALQFGGAPSQGHMPYSGEFAQQTNAALIAGHYLMLADQAGAANAPIARQCSVDSPFVSSSACAANFCKIIAPKQLPMRRGASLESLRVNQVFGLYDGVARSMLRPGMIERDNQGCFTGKEVAQFAKGVGGGKELLRAGASRLGTESGERVCPWTPKNHAHEVPALILKGARDTVVAGCQAEDFYLDGLKGDRAMIEFRGTGHSMYTAPFNLIGERTVYANAFKVVLETFLNRSIGQFRADAAVLENLAKLQATVVDPDPSRAACPA